MNETPNKHLHPGDKSVTTFFGYKGGSQIEITERMDDTDTHSGVCYHVRTIDANRPEETAKLDALWCK